MRNNLDVKRRSAFREVNGHSVRSIATTNQEIQQMTAELVAKHTPFAKECFVESIRVNRVLIPLLVAARMELELSISKETYAEILYQAH
jgi:hypothetical protein